MKYLIPCSLIFASFALSAQTKFPMGNGIDKWGIPLKIPDSDISLRLGARYQSLATVDEFKNLETGEETGSQDFQGRRVRLQFQANVGKQASFVMDLRNDNVNQDDDGEKSFNVGDAYVQLPLEAYPGHAIRLYRAKVDVSRTQTVSSSELLFVNRPYVADEAAQFVSHNRRASNVQLVGNFGNKLGYQLVAGDGVQSGRFNDAKGDRALRIESQNFMLGGKVRLYPVTGWESSKLTETNFGEGKHFSLGLGAFNTSNIRFTDSGNTGTVSRTLLNAEISAHYQNFTIMAEYFKFKGVIEDHTVTTFNKGTGKGWYAQGEWVFPEHKFFAPFVRFEQWDRFVGPGDYLSTSNLLGLNWYLNGNRFRVTAAYERNKLGQDILGSRSRYEAFHLASMWHF